MKLTHIEKLYLGLLAVVFGGIVIHAPLSVWLGTLLPDVSLVIKAWKEVLLLVAIPLAVMLVTRRKLWKSLLDDWLFRLILSFAALHLLLIVFFNQGMASTFAGLAIDLRYLLFFCLVYVAVRTLSQYRKVMIQVGTAGALVVVVFATIQLFLPPDFLSHIGYGKDTIQPYLTVDKNPDYIRHNSTLRGPNPLGAYAGMVLALVVAAWARRPEFLKDKRTAVVMGVLAICGSVALWVSYSRSAWIGAALGVGVVVAATVLRKMSRTSWIVSSAIGLAVVGAFAASSGSEFVSNVILHENPNGGSSVSSNDDHAASLAEGWSRFVRQPWGAGVGSTGSASLYSGPHDVIENQYLFIAHEAGWLGLAIFLAVFGVVLARLWARRRDWLALGTFGGGIALACIGILLPVFTDDTVSIVWWGLAAIALGGNYARHKTK